MAQRYDDLMKLGKNSARDGDLSLALRYLKMARAIDDTDKVRTRIRKLREALEEQSSDESEREDFNQEPQRSNHNRSKKESKNEPPDDDWYEVRSH